MAASISLIKRTYNEWSCHNATRLAAGLAFYTMMSLAPLLVVALTVAGIIYGHHGQANVGQQLGTFIGSDESISGENGIINQMLKTAAQSNHKLGAAIFSFAIALVSATGLLVSLEDALNTIWDVTPKPDAGWRAMVRDRVMSFLLLAGAGVLMIASVILSTVLSKIAGYLGGSAAVHWLLRIGDFAVSFGVITVMFAMIYKFLPDVKIKWSTVWRGAAITAILFTIGKFGLALYFRFAAVGSPFGAAGSLAALLVWIYYSAMLFFFGAAFTRAYADSSGTPIEPNEYAMRVDRRENKTEPAKSPITSSSPAPRHLPIVPRRPSRAMPYVAGGAGFVAGAILSLIGATTVEGQERRLRARIKELGVRDRLKQAEHSLHSAAGNTETLRRMDIAQRVHAVEQELGRVAAYNAETARKNANRLRR